jgi:peptide chain release factor subunit 1
MSARNGPEGYKGPMTVERLARRLVERRPRHRMVSLYLDLDPSEQFATPAARESQINSLVDGAGREVDADDTLDHENLVAAREDLERLRDYLTSDDPPFQGARGLAVFVSGRDELFEVIQIHQPVEARVVIAAAPYIEPLVERAKQRSWCVALVSEQNARIFAGAPSALEEREQIRLRERFEEEDSHLREVADRLQRRWLNERFDLLALGGEGEVVPRLQRLLSQDLRRRLVDRRVAADINSASDAQIRDAVRDVVEEEEAEHERSALDRLNAGLGAGGRAAGGPEATLEALNEQRVEVLLLQRGVPLAGGRCPRDGLLTLATSGSCAADGAELDKVEDLGEAAVEAALLQDAEVIFVERYPDLGPHQGMAALLRF